MRPYGVAIDNSGNAYVTGRTSSSQNTFPLVAGPDFTRNDNGFTFDAFITKINPSGTAVVYSGYIGGAGTDYGKRVAVDSDGSAYVVGQTTDGTGFPTVVGPDLSFNGGDYDGFITKVNPAGTGLVYSGFIGGNIDDVALGVAVDSSGSAYVVGDTNSGPTSFPDGSGFGTIPGYDHTTTGNYDAFFVKVSPMPGLVTVSGQVTDPNGVGLRNASLSMTDSIGNVRTATTSSFGFYTFDNVPAGGTYVMVVNSRLYRFAVQTVVPRDNPTTVNFMGLE